MNQNAETLRELTGAIAESDRPVTSYGMEILELGTLLRNLADSRPDYSSIKRTFTPSTTESGVAIGSWHASLSLEDRCRTAAFIRGAARAVESVLAQRPGHPVHLIEAGCGPLATLSTPLMSWFGPDQLQVTLVDMHQESIDSARHVIGELGFDDHLKNTICGDLMVQEFSEPADVVVLETMYAALFREPQVALTLSLVRALPEAILIPETVSVDLELFNIELEARTVPPVPGERRVLGRILELNRAAALNLAVEDGYLPAATIAIPETVEPDHRLYLTTSVTTFDDVTFANYDSEITIPFPIYEADHTWLGRELQFRYRVSEAPRFEWDLLPADSP